MRPCFCVTLSNVSPVDWSNMEGNNQCSFLRSRTKKLGIFKTEKKTFLPAVLMMHTWREVLHHSCDKIPYSDEFLNKLKKHVTLKCPIQLHTADIFEDDMKAAKIAHHYLSDHYIEINLICKNLKINQNPIFFIEGVWFELNTSPTLYICDYHF